MPKIQIDVSQALPPNSIPVDSALVMKCLDEDGVTTIMVRTSKGLAIWDAVGMFVVASDLARTEAGKDFLSFHEDE